MDTIDGLQTWVDELFKLEEIEQKKLLKCEDLDTALESINKIKEYRESVTILLDVIDEILEEEF